MINFPDTPITNQQFSAAGCTYTWDGQKWRPQTAASGVVTSVTAGTGLTAAPNPIVSSGTISLANTFTVTGPVTINANAAALPAGSANLRIGSVDGSTIPQLQIDAFGAQSYVFLTSSGGTAAARTALPSGAMGGVRYFGYDGTALQEGASLLATSNATWSATSRGTSLNFFTTATGSTTLTNRAIIGQGLLVLNSSGGAPTGGDLGAGTLNAAGDIDTNTRFVAAGQFSAFGNSAGANAACMACFTGAAQGQTAIFFMWGGSASAGGGTAVGSIATTASSTAFNTTSDVRLKADLEPIPDAGDILDRLKPVKFRWRNSEEGELPEGYGFAAQEAHEIFPQAVSPGKGEPGDDDFVPWMMDHSKMVPLLVQEIKQLRSRLAALEEGRH